MVVNALLDALIGAMPVAGNVGDIFWRANTANSRCSSATRARAGRRRRATTRSSGRMAALFGLLVAIPVVIGIVLLSWLWRPALRHWPSRHSALGTRDHAASPTSTSTCPTS